MSQITEFLPQLQQLRTIYTDFVELDETGFDAFRKAVDFYYTHRDVGQFEKMMLDKILEIYYNNDGTFDEAEPECISGNIEMSNNLQIEELIEKLNGCGAEFSEVVDMVT